jgi:hypothetical protein
LSSGFQRITGYITPGYFNEEPGISPPDISIKNWVYHPPYISMKNWVYHPRIFQRRTGYIPPYTITPEYFKEEPGISPPDISMKTGYITPGYVKEELCMSPLNN